MKRLRLAVVVASLGLLIALVVVTVSAWRRSNELEARRIELCHRQRIRLESLVPPQALDARDNVELRAPILFHFLDQALCEMCLGEPFPVDSEPARACWIQSPREECFADLARDLLELYRRRVPRRES